MTFSIIFLISCATFLADAFVPARFNRFMPFNNNFNFPSNFNQRISLASTPNPPILEFSGVRPNALQTSSTNNWSDYIVSTISYSYEGFFAEIASFWNDNSQQTFNRMRHNNCYNFATNIAANVNSESFDDGYRGFAQPGRANGFDIHAEARESNGGHLTCEIVTTGALKDRLIAVDEEEFQANKTRPDYGCHYVHLVVDDRNLPPDFHWYRYEPTVGSFWHKPGEGRVTNVDPSNNIVVEIDVAMRGTRYNLNCGKFLVCEASVSIL